VASALPVYGLAADVAAAVGMLRRCEALRAEGGAAGAAASASAGAALDAADASARALDARRAAVRRALTAPAASAHLEAAVAARDEAEEEHKRCLGAAADACDALAARQRRRAAAAAAIREAAAGAAAAAAAAEDAADAAAGGSGDNQTAAPAASAPTAAAAPAAAPLAGAPSGGDDVASAAQDALAPLRALVLRALPLAAASASASASAAAALSAEASLLASLRPALRAALRAAASAAASAAAAASSAAAPNAPGENGTNASASAGGGADADAAEALGASRRAALQSLRAAATARRAASAAAPRLAAAEAERVRALTALLDISHERSTAQLKREWTPEREARFNALKSKLDAEADAATAAGAAAAAALRAPAVRELYPEMCVDDGASGAHGDADGDAHAHAGGAASSAGADGDEGASSASGADSLAASASSASASSASASSVSLGVACAVGGTASRAGLTDVEVLQRTPRCTVVRVADASRPGAPHRVLKIFPSADSAFLAEARHLAAARHPLVCELLGAFVEGGRAHLLMPFYAGGSSRAAVEALKARKGDLSRSDWAAARRLLRQLLQALAFCHGRGIAHRDVKPENILWRDAPGGRIALADFGLSRDLSRRLETTRAAGGFGGAGGAGGDGLDAGGTPLYAAPETTAAGDASSVGSGASGDSSSSAAPNWKDAPWAVDVFSVGILALEIACGEAVGWSHARGRVEPASAPPGRPLPLPPPPRGGAPMGDFLALALAMASRSPDARPSADEALLHPFFAAADEGGDDAPSTHNGAAAVASGGVEGTPGMSASSAHAPALGAKLAMVGALLGELRVAARATARAASGGSGSGGGSGGGGCYILRVSGGAALLGDCLAAAGACAPSALAAPWAARVGGARAPLSEVLSRAFAAATAPEARLLTRGPDGAYLPRDDSSSPPAPFRALGVLLGKCLLEGVPCGVEWAPLLYASLLGRDARALSDPAAALTHWAAWDAASAGAARAALARGGGADAGASAAAASAAAAALAGPGRASALSAMRDGFSAAAHAAGLAPALALLDEWELGALFFAGAYVDVSELRACLLWDDAWPADDPQKAFLDALLGRLPEAALRLLIARATGRLALRSGGSSALPPPIVVLRSEEDGAAGASQPQPRFPGNRVIALPARCPDAGAFEARMRAALGLHSAYEIGTTTAEEDAEDGDDDDDDGAPAEDVDASAPPPLPPRRPAPPLPPRRAVRVAADGGSSSDADATAAAAAAASSAAPMQRCDAGHAWAGAPGSACAECAERSSVTCCVCLSAPKSTLLLPCRHLCVCNACGTHVVERGSARCPLCRAFIQARVMDVFL
jgi:serine/threonine protein kinase